MPDHPPDDAIVITRQPPPTTERSLIQVQQDAMRQIFQQAGVTLASFAVEIASVARAAAAEGDYSAAANLYKLVGQHIGALQGEKHLHIHANTGTSASSQTDHRSQSDDALRALIAQARAQNEIQDATILHSETNPLPEPTNDTNDTNAAASAHP